RGNTFTLVLESWTDNGGRNKNIRTHDSYLIELGDLKAGDYKLEVVWHGLLQNREKSENVYRHTQEWQGSMAFHVAAAGDGPAKGKLPTLEQNQLKAVDVREELKKAERPPTLPDFPSNLK